MEKFLKRNVVHDNSGDAESARKKVRKYGKDYLSLGFTSVELGGEERPQCVICLTILAADSMKPTKLKRHLETRHKECVGKPVEFFQRKLQDYANQKKTMTKTTTIPSKALLASYKVAYRIAKCKKPHSVGETLILPAAIDMVEIMLGESCAQKLRNIPLADNTVGRRISDMADDLTEQLMETLKESRFALQVDESTDVAGDAQLITYVRYCCDSSIKEDLLFCKQIQGRASAENIFQIIDVFLKEHDINWENCVGLSTDGAPAMSGNKSGLQKLVKEKSPNALWTHCMIHREALASKKMSEELNAVLIPIIKMVNYIKTRPAESRVFAKLCEDMGAEHRALLFYCESRWLSRGKVLARVFELRNELYMYLKDSKYSGDNKLGDQDFVSKLAYLADMFEKLNTLNESMQGGQSHIFTSNDKVSGFLRKLDLWNRKIKDGCLDMFPRLKKVIDGNSITFVSEHLSALKNHFGKYFSDVDMSEIEWVRDPFLGSEIRGLSTSEEEQLIDLSSDSALRQNFGTCNLGQFWLQLAKEYPTLSAKAMVILLPFTTTYLCETGFSAMAAMKTKYRNRLEVEKELRVAISTLQPRFGKLCATKQAHPSH